MASVRSNTMGVRRIASPAIRALMHRRTAELSGLALGLLGLALLVALASYDPRDPSLNTATARHASNLAGPVGAVLADLLLQGFGVAGALPGLALLAWAWRIASHRGLGSMAARLAAMLAALPVLAAVLAAIPPPRAFAWPTVAGLGGAIGRLLARAATGRGARHARSVGRWRSGRIGAGPGGVADPAGARPVGRRVARAARMAARTRAFLGLRRARCRRGDWRAECLPRRPVRPAGARAASAPPARRRCRNRTHRPA